MKVLKRLSLVEFNIHRLLSENHMNLYFTKYVVRLCGLDFD